MKRLRSITILFSGLLICSFDGAFAGTVPQHPEMDNPEYRLDVVTNGYSRWWREVWDSGDNRFRFRLGSNNVTQWFIDEQLKFSADLIDDRLRFRFYHTRIKPFSTDNLSTDVLEFEGRFWQRNYLSVYARPTSDKREGSLGFMLQNRKSVDRFVKVSVEWPGIMRNFFEHYRDTPDSLLNIFIDRPVRFGLDVRAEILTGVWVRVLGEYVPDFVMGEEVTATGEQIPKERAEAKALSGWVEYVMDPSRELRGQTALGIEYNYQKSRKSKDPECGCSVWDDYLTGGPHSPGCQAFSAPAAADKVPGGDDLRHVPPTHFGRDLYQRTEDDSVAAWRDSRWFLAPYAWIALSDRITLRANVRMGEQEIGTGDFNEQTDYTTQAYVVPLVGLRYSFGRSRAAVLETGLVSEWRKRTDEVTDELNNRVETGSENFDDHRLYVGFEYVFGDSKMIRFVEAFELDAEDRGDFAIHDHGFFQVIFGF